MVIGRAVHGSCDHEADPVQSVQRWTVHSFAVILGCDNYATVPREFGARTSKYI